MQIRNKLTLQFTGIVAFILLIFSISIYNLSARYTYYEFEERLKERALNTAQLLLEVDEIDEALLKSIRRKYLQTLHHEFVRIYDKNNEPIFKDDVYDIRISKEKFDYIRYNGELGFSVGNQQIYGISYIDNQKEFVVVASAIDKWGNRKLSNLKILLFAGYFLCLFIIYFGGKLFSIAALRPIAKVVHDVEQMTADKLHIRLDEGRGKDEVEKLAMTFNRLFVRLKKSFDLQKMFVSSASHELRTPLTAITGEVEVALMKEREKEEYQRVLYSVLDETKKLTNLSNGLLELVQSANEDNAVTLEPVNLKKLIKNAVAEIQRHYTSCEILVRYNVNIEDEDLCINGSKALLKAALLNIMENACKFSNAKPISVDFDKKDASLEVKVTDQGIGISEEDIKNIFQPFYRSENVRAIPGHGIGLALTEKIIKLHNGHIVIDSIPNQGTTVQISFPKGLL